MSWAFASPAVAAMAADAPTEAMVATMKSRRSSPSFVRPTWPCISSAARGNNKLTASTASLSVTSQCGRTVSLSSGNPCSLQSRWVRPVLPTSGSAIGTYRTSHLHLTGVKRT